MVCELFSLDSGTKTVTAEKDRGLASRTWKCGGQIGKGEGHQAVKAFGRE